MDDKKNLLLPIILGSKESEKELIGLLNKVDCESMLSVMMANLLITTAEQGAESEMGSNFALIEILAELCIPNFGKNLGAIVTPWESGLCHDLLQKCLTGRMFSKFDKSSPNSLASSLHMRSEVVRGSAYPEQTRNKILQIQGRFDNWFDDNIGISPTRAIDIIYCLNEHLENNFNKNKERFREAGKECGNKFISITAFGSDDIDEKEFFTHFKDKESATMFGYIAQMNGEIPQIFPFEIQELSINPPASKRESDALKKLIGISKETYKENIDIQRHPLYILDSGKVLISNISHCLDVLWDKYESVAKSTKPFFDGKYQRHKSKWLEKEGVLLLEKIFPRDSIFHTLDYPDPDKASGNAELDIAVKWGPFLLLIEAKASQFQFESTRGNVGSLKCDIKRNIEDAYKQSMRALRYIESTEEAIFTERNSGRILSFKKTQINLIYPISLSLHHLADIATELHKTRELNLFDNNSYPFSICLADLEMILKTSITPDILLHYIKKRLEILSVEEDWSGDELDLFGAYLGFRLNMNNIPNLPKNSDFTHLSFSGYSEDFNRLMKHERGETSESPQMNLSLPDEVLLIFDQLRKWDDDEARYIAFALLDLDDDLLFTIAKAINELKKSTIEKDVFRVCSFSNDEVVVSISGSSSATLPELINRTSLRSSIEKYRKRLKKSIGFGIICHNQGSSPLFDVAQYSEFEWFPNSEFDKLLKKEPNMVRLVTPNKIGRNDPCPCGSGKKYKKCHFYE